MRQLSGMNFFFSGRRRHTRCIGDWSSDVCSSDLAELAARLVPPGWNETVESARRRREHVEGAEAVRPVGRWDSARSEERRVGKEWKGGGGAGRAGCRGQST